MQWKYVKPLKYADLIDDFECRAKYVFCDSFRKCVMANNGGRPEKRGFDTDLTKGRSLKTFLSFNPEDRSTVWKYHDWHKDEFTDRYIIFANDNFGNWICFDANNDQVVFIDHEDMTVEHIAPNFDGFLNALYEE